MVVTMQQLEFELAFYDIEVLYVNHNPSALLSMSSSTNIYFPTFIFVSTVFKRIKSAFLLFKSSKMCKDETWYKHKSLLHVTADRR